MHLDASDPVSTVTPHPSYMHLTGEITEGENEIHTSLKGETTEGENGIHPPHAQEPYLISNPTIRRKGRWRM